MPVFFAIDPSAASKLKNLGRWDAGEACGTRLGD
jgi:hypothetical protein